MFQVAILIQSLVWLQVDTFFDINRHKLTLFDKIRRLEGSPMFNAKKNALKKIIRKNKDVKTVFFMRNFFQFVSIFGLALRGMHLLKKTDNSTEFIVHATKQKKVNRTKA